MAAAVSSPWGKPGAWALEAEEHEAELQQQQQGAHPQSDFPSLAAAAAAKQPKKKKNQTVSLAEFVKPSSEPKGLTHEDLLHLPTGPRQRSPEELDRSGLGGGFKSYGVNNRSRDGNSRGGFNRDAVREPPPPSRADETDNWSEAKKPPVRSGYERRERGGGSFSDSHSKADESDNWVANKPIRTAEPPRRSGVGFERRGSFDSLQRGRDSHVPHNSSGGPADSDSWARRKEEAADSDKWPRRKEEPNGTGGAMTVRSKLVLQPRTLPVSNGNDAAMKPSKGANPFGEARPREEVLKEKGQDWKEMDEKLESLKINGNGNKESDRGESREKFGWRSSGNGPGGAERSWRKPADAVADSGSRPQSSEKSENGHPDEHEHPDENGLPSESGSAEEN